MKNMIKVTHSNGVIRVEQEVLFDVFARAGHAERPVAYAFDRAEFIGKFLDLAGLAFYCHYLQAVVVVKVDMLGGDDDVLMVVLQVGKLARKAPLVMVVDEGDGAGHLLVLFPLVFDQFLADKIPKGLGPGRIAFFLDEAIELIKQTVFERYTESYEF